MTTFVNFAPSTSGAFQFQANLDNQTYNAIVTSLLFGNRYYLNLYALDGTLIISTALVGSPTGIAIQALSWANGSVSVTTAAPHGYAIASTIMLTLTGSSPDAYNGLVAAFITGPSTFTYPVAADPGSASTFGTASFNVNMIGGVPDENGTPFSSTLIFREQSQQFEISP